MSRILIVPAAGAGSRLGSSQPKLLVPVAGRPMIQHLLDLYEPFVERAAIVVHPSAVEAVRSQLPLARVPVELFVQELATGMLDAILLASSIVERHRPDRVWITWCDQVAIHPRTLARLAQEERDVARSDVILPTSHRAEPYIHLERAAGGRIVRVLHRREGDVMPATGESDSGLFDLSRVAFLDWLPEYARQVRPATGTRERNFLPFIAWVADRTMVRAFPCTEPQEAVGVNTPEDLAFVEAHLRARSSVA